MLFSNTVLIGVQGDAKILFKPEGVNVVLANVDTYGRDRLTAIADELRTLETSVLRGGVLANSTIMHIREMTVDEMSKNEWQQGAPVIELSDGTKLYPATPDGEPGLLYGETAEGEAFQIEFE